MSTENTEIGCRIEGCGKLVKIKNAGLCSSHYRYWRLYGDPTVTRYGRPIAQRFWEKVDKSGECWIWTSNRYTLGYGKFWHNGREHPAHRIAWMLAYGSMPEGLDVLHRCDNPPCVNPAHLFVGTHADNMRDKAEKNRTAFAVHPEIIKRGADHPGARLTKDQVSEIRQRFSGRYGEQADLARAYGVAPSTLHDIVRRKRYL